MRTLLRALALLAVGLLPVLTSGCETCTTNGERRCGDAEILTCVDSPDAMSSFEIATPCGGANPTCVEDLVAYPPIAACVLAEGQDGCNTCQDARYLRTCAMVGSKPVVMGVDCRAQFPDPNFPGICDPAYSGCRQCNPAAENCDGTCSPGETRCMNGLLSTCLDDGKSWSGITCGAPNSQCVEDTSVTPRVAACVNQSYSSGCNACVESYYHLQCFNVGTIPVVIAYDCRITRGDNYCDVATTRCAF